MSYENIPLPINALIKIPRQPRSVNMVHCILDAGIKVIEKNSVLELTTNKVADIAGISIGSLYQYFANRESIIAGIIERSLLHVRQILQQFQYAEFMQLDVPVEISFEQSLRVLLHYFDEHMIVVKKILLETPILTENGLSKVLEEMLADIFRTFLIQNSQRYRLKDGAAGLFVTVNSLIYLYLKWLVSPPLFVSEEAFIKAVVRQFLSAVEYIENPAWALTKQLNFVALYFKEFFYDKIAA